MAGKPLATLESGSRLRVISKAAVDWRPALKEIGIGMLFSATEAFKKMRRGRHKWPPRGVPNVMGVLSDLERGADPPKRRFDKTDAKKKVGRDTGALLASLSPSKLSSPTATTIEVGTRLPYASKFALGHRSSKAVSGLMKDRLADFLQTNPRHSPSLSFLFNRDRHEITVPPRPFMIFTRQDRRDASEILQEHIKGS